MWCQGAETSLRGGAINLRLSLTEDFGDPEINELHTHRQT